MWLLLPHPVGIDRLTAVSLGEEVVQKSALEDLAATQAQLFTVLNPADLMRESFVAKSGACHADITRIRCFACDVLTGCTCALCRRPVCGEHSIYFAHRNGRVVSRICYPCDDTTSSEDSTSSSELIS